MNKVAVLTSNCKPRIPLKTKIAVPTSNCKPRIPLKTKIKSLKKSFPAFLTLLNVSDITLLSVHQLRNIYATFEFVLMKSASDNQWGHRSFFLEGNITSKCNNKLRECVRKPYCGCLATKTRKPFTGVEDGMILKWNSNVRWWSLQASSMWSQSNHFCSLHQSW